MKRCFDLLFTLILLCVLAIPLLAISIWIKLDSKGPVFFKQKRKGQYDQYFEIYKFRTMVTETPNVATDQLQDPERFITKSGRFLRTTSLDELPQLFNILKGEMSFVGPRPALYNQFSLIQHRDAHHVHTVKPGLTGYAQINGRDFITDEEKVHFDAFYVQHQTFQLDCHILYKTVADVLVRKGIQQ